jgi:hypothetical protein
MQAPEGQTMGVANIAFSDDCVVVVGGQPAQPDEPILDPRPVGRTNIPFIIADGLHCFSLLAAQPFTPLWQIGQVTPARVLRIEFK